MIMLDMGRRYQRTKQCFRKHSTMAKLQEGKMGYILLWLLGIPIPVLLLIFLLRGCD
jgi:hypothetical protein